MSQEAPSATPPEGLDLTTNFVHAFMRFAWLMVCRVHLVLACLGVTVLFGGIHYMTATRTYRACASVLVQSSGPDATSASMISDRGLRDQMSTYERMITSAVVLEEAIEYIETRPPEIAANASNEEWLTALRGMIDAKTIRRTSIIEVSCRSADPVATVSVVNGVVRAYLDYIDRTHRSISADVIEQLDRQRVSLGQRLAVKERELLAAKKASADLGIHGGTQVVHPVIQNVMNLNESVSKARERRVQLEASLSAIRNTVRSGGDLRQHLLTLEPLIGRDLLLTAVGMNSQDALTLRRINEELLDYQAKLAKVQNHYGPAHPQVRQLEQQLANIQQYRSTFQNGIDQRLLRTRSPELGQMLLQMVEEDLAGAWANERELVRQFQTAEAKALALNDRLAHVAILDRNVQVLRNLQESLSGRIENIDINQNQSDLRVFLVSHPTEPKRPVSPVLARVGLFCLFVGLGIASLVVYVLDVIDDRFRSPEELQDQLGLPVMAMIPRHPVLTGSGPDMLQVHRAPNAKESEAFRTLRTTLAFSTEDINHILVTSAEPGDGKTTVLCNLGTSYAQSGKRVLLIDGDVRKPGLSRLFDVKRGAGLSDLLRSEEALDRVASKLVRPTGVENMDVLSCGPRPPDPAELVGSDRFVELIAWAGNHYDQVLVDSPPLLAASDAAVMSRVLDAMLVVVQPQKNHRRRVQRAILNLRGIVGNVVGVIVNAVDEKDDRGYHSGYGYGYGYGYGLDEEEGGEPSEKMNRRSSCDETVCRAEEPVETESFWDPTSSRRAA